MKNLVLGFPEQLEEAIEIGSNAKLTPAETIIHNVLICGLGGSGIGGTIVSEIISEETKVPVNISKGYFIPGYIDQHSLVIISSYSGDTEETLNAFHLAMERNAKIVCISSGGKTIDIAREKGLDHIVVPGGMPPRACLGYSITQLFFILEFHSVIGNTFLTSFKNGIKLLRDEQKKIMQEAEQLAARIQGKMPVIYATTYNEGLAIRLRQQFNENSKILCWHHVFPELNHNELVGWTREHNDIAVLILRDPDEYTRNNSRIEISKKVIGQYTPDIIEIYSKGSSRIEKALYMIHLGDWISCYLAEKRGVDAVDVSVINHLKSELAKI